MFHAAGVENKEEYSKKHGTDLFLRVKFIVQLTAYVWRPENLWRMESAVNWQFCPFLLTIIFSLAGY